MYPCLNQPVTIAHGARLAPKPTYRGRPMRAPILDVSRASTRSKFVRGLLALAALALLELGLACNVPILRAAWIDSNGGELNKLEIPANPGDSVQASLQFVPADNESAGLDVRLNGTQASWLSAT